MRCRTEGREVAGVPMGWGWGQRGAALKGCRKGIPTPLWELGGLSPLQGLALCRWLLCPPQPCTYLLCFTGDHCQVGAHPSAVLLTLSQGHQVSRQVVAALLKAFPALRAARPALPCAGRDHRVNANKERDGDCKDPCSPATTPMVFHRFACQKGLQ